MKSGALQPREGQCDFGLADRFVALGEQSGFHMTGHTLVWHSQAPAWFFIDEEGEEVTREVLIRRMENHIKTVVGRYRGRIAGWDVVNEDRKGVVEGQSVSVRVDLGGRRIIKKNI